MKSRSAAFLHGRSCIAISMHPEEYYLPCKKALSELRISHYTSLYACTEQLCICDNADSLRISANADLLNALKCLASGKKLIRTALKLLLVYSTSSTLVLYIIVHYTYMYGMLILPRVDIPCPPPIYFRLMHRWAPFRLMHLCHSCTSPSLHLLTCRVWSYGADNVGRKVPPGLGGVSAEVPLQHCAQAVGWEQVQPCSA